MPRSAIATLALLSLVAADLAWAEGSTAQQRAWTLAATALLTESNGERHDILAGTELTPGNVERVRRTLKDWWGVTDRGGLLESLKWLEDSGHRVQFARMGAWLTALTPDQRRALDLQRRRDFRLNQKVGVVELHYERLSAKSITGWDFARFLSLCRWGYAAGYLTEEEAWARMVPAARILRQTFSSWRDLGENYLIGRQFWDPEEHVQSGHRYRQALDRLLSEPGSPWNRVPWAVDFGPPRAAQVAARATGAAQSRPTPKMAALRLPGRGAVGLDGLDLAQAARRGLCPAPRHHSRGADAGQL